MKKIILAMALSSMLFSAMPTLAGSSEYEALKTQAAAKTATLKKIKSAIKELQEVEKIKKLKEKSSELDRKILEAEAKLNELKSKE